MVFGLRFQEISEAETSWPDKCAGSSARAGSWLKGALAGILARTNLTNHMISLVLPGSVNNLGYIDRHKEFV
jgi:hypothetical protein